MGMVVAALAVVIIAIASKSILGVSLVTALVLAASFKLHAEDSFLVAFLGGVVVSFVDGSLMGLESLGLIGASGLIHLYKRRFSSRHFAFFVVFALLGSLVHSLVVEPGLDLTRIAFDVIGMLIFTPFVDWWKDRFFPDQIMLKL